MLLKRSVYNEVKGFDEDYFMYGEDIDFSYKITKAGYKNHYLGSSVMLHYKGESTQKDTAYLDRFYGAMEIFYKKHFNTNFLFDSSVKFGVFVAKKLNKTSKKKSDTSNENNITYVLTENIILLKNISENINSEIKTTSKTIFSDEILTNSNFIFDVDYMSYSQIFMVMRKLRGKGNTFRISPPGCNFILGSDQSDQKGSVLVF
jgi:hypothetical protein